MKTIDKILEEFEERYFDKNTPSGLNQKDFSNYPSLVKDTKSFIAQSFKEFLEGEIERMEWEEKGHDPDDEVSKWHFEKKGFNSALSHQIEHYKELIKELNYRERVK
jgi:hypothetical protein